MYKIAKNVIGTGRYQLEKMMKQLSSLWLQGDLTDGQYDELKQMAQENATPEYDMANMNERISKLEERKFAAQEAAPGTDIGRPDSAEKDWPDYIPGHNYLNGERCTFEGKRYVSTLPAGVAVNVWSPAAYPTYWREEQ